MPPEPLTPSSEAFWLYVVTLDPPEASFIEAQMGFVIINTWVCRKAASTRAAYQVDTNEQ